VSRTKHTEAQMIGPGSSWRRDGRRRPRARSGSSKEHDLCLEGEVRGMTVSEARGRGLKHYKTTTKPLSGK
jgi:hypothetical protein